jgi:hypothetical protein
MKGLGDMGAESAGNLYVDPAQAGSDCTGIVVRGALAGRVPATAPDSAKVLGTAWPSPVMVAVRRKIPGSCSRDALLSSRSRRHRVGTT